MKKLIALFFPIFISLNSFSQYKIEGTITGYEEKQMLFSSIYGHLETAIDTIKTDENGHFKIILPKNSTTGLYRLNLRTQEYLDLIFNKENIKFNTIVTGLIDSIQFSETKENKIYYDFYKKSKQDHYKIELLTPLLNYFPMEDSFYMEIVNKLKNTQANILTEINKIKSDQKNTFASKLILSEIDPILYWNPTAIDQKKYLKNHFLDYIDFNDLTLMNSDIFASKAIQFISIYGDKNLNREQQGEEFIKAIDILLSEASVNKIVFDYIFEYIVEGFERFDYENVMTHISETYINDETCQDDADKEKLKKRIEKYKQLSIGKPAPDFEIESNLGEVLKLKEIESEYTLLLFWASWCDHCKESLPQIAALYNIQTTKKMKVIAISLDNKKAPWLNAIEPFPAEWMHVSQLKGWDSPITDLYNIYATPSMLLLDKEKRILSKPENIGQLENALIKENILN